MRVAGAGPGDYEIVTSPVLPDLVGIRLGSVQAMQRESGQRDDAIHIAGGQRRHKIDIPRQRCDGPGKTRAQQRDGGQRENQIPESAGVEDKDLHY
jgi:hypothetical protein